MGRRRNPPLSIIVSGGTTEVTAVSDGLPAFKRYIDVYSESERQKKIVRWFFVTPSQEEINDTTTLYRCKEIDVVVLSASMPYMPRKLRTRDPLFEYCLKKGFSEEFSTDLVRLVINFLEGKRCGYGVLSGYAGALQELMNFLATHTNNRSELTLKDINKQVWLDYLSHKEAEHRPEAAKIHFNSARGFFKKYQPTSLDGWLNLLSFRTKNHERPSQEHTSELASTSDYSNVIMYQLLALFTEGFQRRVGYLMHFERLTEADMPQDWIYPGRKKCYLTQKERGKTRRSITETSVLFSKWLHDEDDGYQILIDHYIMYYKAGLVNKNAQSRSGFRQLLKSLSKTDLNPLVIKFHETMGRWHGFDYERHSLSLLNFYVRKKTSSPNVSQTV